MHRLSSLLLVVLFFQVASCHMAMWHPSTFDKQSTNITSEDLGLPLQDSPFNVWWWHGNLNFPPDPSHPNSTFILPANGEASVELSTYREYTSMGTKGMIQPDTPNPWNGFSWGNSHAFVRNDVAGCAWGITYKSNQYDVKPEDFVIFSVVHDCPARQLQKFQIPNLPACPNGKCLCAWFWIHKSSGGTDQMYMVPFVCNVTNVQPNALPIDVDNALPPRKCNDPATCTQGPRNPMYWRNLERNNMFEPYGFAPTYSILYGFSEGAQFDIFVNTNPITRREQEIPPEQKCTNPSVNPTGLPSRITSDGNTTFNNRLFSPNCQYTAYIQQYDGNLIMLDLVNGQALVWRCLCENSTNSTPFQVVVSSNGELQMKDSKGKVTWDPAPLAAGVGKGPYVFELTNTGVLLLTDSQGRNLFETYFFDRRDQGFSSLTPDPSIWPSSPTYYDYTAPVPIVGKTAQSSGSYASLSLIIVVFAILCFH